VVEKKKSAATYVLSLYRLLFSLGGYHQKKGVEVRSIAELRAFDGRSVIFGTIYMLTRPIVVLQFGFKLYKPALFSLTFLVLKVQKMRPGISLRIIKSY
jgi:hypothetical protein